MKKALLLLCGLALCARPAAAQNDADQWLEKPYPLKVVLHVHPHPVMTEDYVRQLRIELTAGLKQHFGTVADVKVIDARESKLMKEVLAKGWSALDDKNLITDEKEHLIQLRFADGAYELEARQWDGFTGLCSTLRTNRTADRSWVARQATLMVVQDFGVVAKVTNYSQKTQETGVKLHLKAWKLADRPQALRLQRGEVFAFTRIKEDAEGNLRSERLQDALLVVTIYDDSEAICDANWQARFVRFSPFYQDPRDTRFKGFRALKLGTRQAPLKIQLVDKDTGEVQPGCKVVVQRGEGSDRKEIPLQPDANAPGTYESHQPFAHFARVVVTRGSVVLAEVPVPILTEDTISLKLTGTREAIKLAEFEYDYNQWRRPLADVIDMVDRNNPKFKELIAAGKRQEALKLFKQSEETLKRDLERLRENFEEVKQLAAQAGPATKTKIAEGERYLKDLGVVLESYRRYIRRVETPTPDQEAVDQGEAAENAYDFENAIRFYRKSLQLNPNQPVLKKKFDTMARAWEQPRNAPLMEARKYVLGEWATTEWQQLEDKVAEVQKHVATMKSSRDHLTALLLVNVNQRHLKKLAEVQANLGSNEGDQEKAAMIKKVGESLTKMNTELLDFYEASRQ
jgi:tetratricopeptide (TPR) repeat protein